MDCYVAGKTPDVMRVQTVQRMAVEAGHQIVFDWTGSEGKIRKSWREHSYEAAVLAQREVAAAKCELFVLVTPSLGGLGCYVEFCVALGHGAHCIVLPLTSRDSVFFYHPNVWIVGMEQLKDELELAPYRAHGITRPTGRTES